MYFCTYKVCKKGKLAKCKIWSVSSRNSMKMEKKSIRIIIRLSPTEYELFKSKNYKNGNLSQMIRDAVLVFDPIETRGKLATINELSNNLQTCTVELSRIGNNINQIAHVLNADYMNNLVHLRSFRESRYNDVQDVITSALNEIAGIKMIENKIYRKMLSK